MKLFLCLLLAAFLHAADFDLLIRNARVIDGTGNPWFRADIGVKDGRVAAIGKLTQATAYRIIEAGERIAAPGFIDVHTHIEGGVEKIPRADNYLLDGVTAVVTGNCGGSALPLGEWFSKLEGLGLGINVASLVGHNTVRAQVMGRENRKATRAEIVRMEALVEQAMLDGAVGFSTGLIYIPGTYSSTEEVVALGKAAARHGGVYASHMRDEGAKVLEAIEEAIRVGKEGGVPVQLSHFKIDNKRLWGSSDKSLALVDKYRREGVDVVIDQYPYDRSSTNLGIVMPSWSLAGGADAVAERLKNPETRDRVVREMKQRLNDLGHQDYSYAMIAGFRVDPSLEGKTISQANAAKGRPKTLDSEIETIFEIMLSGGAQMVYHSMGEQDVDRIMRYPHTAIASDSGVREFGVGMPHPRGYGTNARVLGEYVRKRGVLTLEDAIRRMTSLPARTFGFRDRGLLREGMAADIVLFDPARVQDKSTFARPHQYSEGFDFVIVNGVVAVENGKLSDARGGRILRRPAQ